MKQRTLVPRLIFVTEFTGVKDELRFNKMHRTEMFSFFYQSFTCFRIACDARFDPHRSEISLPMLTFA